VIFGFWLSGPDNDSSMLDDAPDAPRCPRCGFALDHAWINPRFKLNVKRWDLTRVRGHSRTPAQAKLLVL
jgi:hypothetical protein